MKIRIGLSVFLFLILLTLKLTGAIAWSWWIITAPLWAPVALMAIITIAVAGLFLVAFLILLAGSVIEVSSARKRP